MAGFLDDFFNSNKYGNYYQGTSTNNSGQLYSPAAYNGRGVYNTATPNSTDNINPLSYYRKSPGDYPNAFDPSLMRGDLIRTIPSLNSLYYNQPGITVSRGDEPRPTSIYDNDFWKNFTNQLGWQY